MGVSGKLLNLCDKVKITLTSDNKMFAILVD